jgi:bacillithiol system protein YtxJ
LADVQELTKVEEWKRLLAESENTPVMLIKHSTRCPISAGAHDEFLKHVHVEALPGVRYARVLVVENRTVSNAVAEDTGVKHESPQVLLLKNGASVWTTSHGRITAAALKEQASRLD